MARPRKNPQTGEGAQTTGEGTPKTGSSGTRHRTRLTLSSKVRAMENNRSRLVRLADQIKQIAREG
jgi:hypothetical protein